LCGGKVQLSSSTDFLGIPEPLNLSVAGSDELCLVGFVTAFFALRVLPLPLLAFSLLLFRLSFIVKPAKGLTNGGNLCTSVLLRDVVESGCWFLLERDVCIVLQE
jgi:hypothetical protein